MSVYLSEYCLQSHSNNVRWSLKYSINILIFVAQKAGVATLSFLHYPELIKDIDKIDHKYLISHKKVEKKNIN